MENKGAWHGDPELKAQVLARMIKHREDDEIIHGIYQYYDPDTPSRYKGCLIGCTLPKQALDADGDLVTPGAGWHEEVERLYGIPADAAEILDISFERLYFDAGAEFAVDSIAAIEPGADLSGLNRWYYSQTPVNGERPYAFEVLEWIRAAPKMVPEGLSGD